MSKRNITMARKAKDIATAQEALERELQYEDRQKTTEALAGVELPRPGYIDSQDPEQM
jgi:hypothetical protein